MPDENTARTGISTAMAGGALLILAGLVWLLVLRLNTSEPTAVAGADRPAVPTAAQPVPTVRDQDQVDPEPTLSAELEPTVASTAEPTVSRDPEPTVAADAARTLSSRLLLESDVSTGSTEFSAVTFNEELDRLLIADDEGRIFEFDLDTRGEPVQPPRRTLRVAVGAGDIEGLAWMNGSTYAIAHEDDGQLTIVAIDDNVLTITDEHLVDTIDTRIREDNGNGLEGVAVIRHDQSLAFAVVDERPPTLYLIDQAGAVTQTIPIDLGIPDISDVWVSDDGIYSVLSDEGRIVVDLRIDATGAVTATNSQDLAFIEGWFEQPEGVARSRNGDRLYVVGEDPGPGRYSFGLWLFD